MKKKSNLILVAVALTTISACSSSPDNKIRIYSEESNKLSKQWDKGNDLVVDGQALIKKGKKQILDGEDKIQQGENNISKGEEMIEKGKIMKLQSEETFKKMHPTQSMER